MQMSYHHAAASPTRQQSPVCTTPSGLNPTLSTPSPHTTYSDVSHHHDPLHTSEMDTPTPTTETTSPASSLSTHQTDSSFGPGDGSGSGQHGGVGGSGIASGWWWSLPPIPVDPSNQAHNPFTYGYPPFSMNADSSLAERHASEMPSPNTPSSEHHWDAAEEDSFQSKQRCHSTPNFSNMDLDFYSPTRQLDPAETPPGDSGLRGSVGYRDLDLDGDLDGDLGMATRRAVSFNIPEDSEGETDTDRMHMTEPEDQDGVTRRKKPRDGERVQRRVNRERSGSGSQGRRSESDTREMSEEEKKINRRLRNSVASLKLREKRKKEYEMLDKMARDKTKLAKELGDQVMLLETEARYLKQLVMFHSISNPTAMAAMQFHMATNQMIASKSDQVQSDRNRTSDRDPINPQSNVATVFGQTQSGEGNFPVPPSNAPAPPAVQSNVSNPAPVFPFIQSQPTNTNNAPANPTFQLPHPPPPQSLQTPASYPFLPTNATPPHRPTHPSPGPFSSGSNSSFPPPPPPQHTTPSGYFPVPFRRHASYGSGQQNPTHPPSSAPFTHPPPPSHMPGPQPHPTGTFPPAVSFPPQNVTSGSSPPPPAQPGQASSQPPNHGFPLNVNMNDPAAAAAAMAFAAFYGGLPTHLPPPPVSGNTSHGPYAQADVSNTGSGQGRPEPVGSQVSRLDKTASGTPGESTGLPLPPFFSSFYPPADPFAPNLPNMGTDNQNGASGGGNQGGSAAPSPSPQTGAGRKAAGTKQKGSRKRR